jgi:hypothetical protein
MSFQRDAKRTFYSPLGIDFHSPYLKEDERISLLSAGRTGGRMDLVIAIVHGATILDVSSHTTHGGRRQ